MEEARPTIKISSVILTAIAAAAAFADSSSGPSARKGCRHPWTISKSGLSRFSRNAATPLDPRAPSALQPGACALKWPADAMPPELLAGDFWHAGMPKLL